MMLSALPNEKWFAHSYPFSPFGDMESEIAELRTLTKVTKLRQQIECRQEGAWMVVRDIPDEKSKSGTRKVTSYGRASRSITRAFSQNVTGKLFDTVSPSNVVVEHPSDVEEEEQDNCNKSVEITEVTDEPPNKITEPSQTQTPLKKTSVVTLGKGNLVLIDDEDSNFQVTGISKGRVADAVSTLERVAQGGEKKVKKVGFCKTEVHFAPDSGRVKIVETDEKPPPTQMVRKKKRPRMKTSKTDLPKTYFGNPPIENIKEDSHFINQNKSVFSVIREPSPLLTLSTRLEVAKPSNDVSEDYGYVKKVSLPPPQEQKTEETKSDLSYLGNVSPKLSKLLQNSMQHEFQVKHKQIMKTKEATEERSSTSKKLTCEIEPNKLLKIVTQVSLGAGGGEIEHKFVVKTDNKESEPIYINKDVTVELRNDNAVNTPLSTPVKDKIPKPRPRTTVLISPQVKDVRNAKLIRQPEKVIKKVGVTSKTKEVIKKDSAQIKLTPKQGTRSSVNRTEKKVVKCEVTTPNTKLQKLIKNGSAQDKPPPEVRVRKIREPLRSFEKVSNGWVGHCITPIKGSIEVKPKEAQINASNKVLTSKASSTVHSSQSQGSKRSSITTSSKSTVRTRNEDKSQNKNSLTVDNKQFSLSREHLRSAKLVKELALKDKHRTGNGDLLTDKKKVSSSTTHTNNPKPRTITPQTLGNRPAPRIGIVKPRIVQQIDSTTNKNNSTVAVRIGLRRTEHSLIRQRRDSEQSDDSVIRADEEVRAYMFNSRHKVVNCCLLRPASGICGDGKLDAFNYNPSNKQDIKCGLFIYAVCKYAFIH